MIRLVNCFILINFIIATYATSPPVQCPASDGSTTVYLPDPKDCTKFYKCANSIAHPFVCPAGLYFNPQLDVCDWPSNVNCFANKTTTPQPLTTTKRPPIPPHPTKIPPRPPVPPHPTKIPPRPPVPPHPTKAPKVKTTKVSSICNQRPNDVYLTPDPTDCAKFLLCNHGKEKLLACPKGEHFNPVLLICTSPSQAGCRH